MARTGRVILFQDESIAKNASSCSDPVYLGKCGPETEMEVEIGVSGGGIIQCTYKVGNGPDKTFYKPSDAVTVCASHDAGSNDSTGRDRYTAHIRLTEWVEFLVEEKNASNVNASLYLYIAQ